MTKSVKIPAAYQWFLIKDDISVVNCYPDEINGFNIEVKYKTVAGVTFVYRFVDKTRGRPFSRLIPSYIIEEGYEMSYQEKQYFHCFFKRNRRKKEWEYENLWIRKNQIELLNLLQSNLGHLDNEHKMNALIYLESLREII